MENAKKEQIHQLMSWTLVGLWMAVIFYLSHQPAEASSELSSGITHLIIQTIQWVLPFGELNMDSLHFYVRKGAHFFAYFTLGLLVVHALFTSRQRGFRGMTLALMICVIYAISDEVHQLFIPGRSGEVTDVIIDSAGASVGIMLYGIFNYLLNKKK